MTEIFDQALYLREEPVCALDPLLLIPRIEYAPSIFSSVYERPLPYTLVILDMIQFHLINDIYGYEAGDSVLLDFISFVRAALPSGSIAMRFRHGDEFLFFAPLPEAQTHDLFASIQHRSALMRYPQLGSDNDFRASFRFATMEMTEPHKDHRTLLRAAEVRLRAVKGQGTPRVVTKQG